MKLRSIMVLMTSVMLIAACGSESGGDPTTTTGGSDTEAPSTTSSGEPTTSPAGNMDGVHIADSSLGEILVDPEGFTLYIFTADTDGESACYDACADLWPPVSADTSISSDLDASIFGSTARTDGSQQLTVNGMPLYLYTPDANPGDATGQGFNDVWFVVDGRGSVIEASAASDIAIDYGY